MQFPRLPKPLLPEHPWPTSIKGAESEIALPFSQSVELYGISPGGSDSPDTFPREKWARDMFSGTSNPRASWKSSGIGVVWCDTIWAASSEDLRLGLELVRFLKAQSPLVPVHQSKLVPSGSPTSAGSATWGPSFSHPWGSREICKSCLLMASGIRCQQGIWSEQLQSSTYRLECSGSSLSFAQCYLSR